MFLHVSVILFMGGLGWYPSMHCRWHPSMPCSRSPGGLVSQHALQVSRPTSRGKLRGLAWGGSPTPKEGLQANTQGGLQANTQGGLQAHTQGVSRSTWGGLQAHTREGCIPACIEADPLTATAAGSTHPTGMHSTFVNYFCSICLIKREL